MSLELILREVLLGVVLELADQLRKKMNGQPPTCTRNWHDAEIDTRSTGVRLRECALQQVENTLEAMKRECGSPRKPLPSHGGLPVTMNCCNRCGMAQKELLDSIFSLAIRLFKSERIQAGISCRRTRRYCRQTLSLFFNK